MAQIGNWVREIVEAQENTRFDRAHFSSFGASSLDFEVVYYVLNPDYNIYMDIQQEINLGLMRKLAAAQVEFAFPTRTLYFESSEVEPSSQKQAST
jgi:small-conductance mechanosensitive channel